MTRADHDALREGLARWFLAEAMDPQGRSPEGDADAVLGLPELAPLLAKAESVERVAAERDEARATNRDLHRRTQKAERFRARYGGSINSVISRIVKERRMRIAATARADRLAAENAALRAALEDTRAAADDLVPVCLDEGDNRAAGALQFISGFISDRLAGLRTDPPAGTDAPVQEGQPHTHAGADHDE